MNIFGRLFRKKPVIESCDPIFGRITFQQGIWTFIPSPPTEGFMVTVEAPEAGPTPGQRAFFQHVRSRLAEFEQRARDYVRSRAEDGTGVSRLSTYSLEIGDAEDTGRGEFVLELSDPEAIVIHRVSFRGDEAVDYGFDD